MFGIPVPQIGSRIWSGCTEADRRRERDRLVGRTEYNFGPFGIGASYYNMQEQGSAAKVHISQRYDDTLAVGGSWVVTPGLTATFDYLYGQVHPAT